MKKTKFKKNLSRAIKEIGNGSKIRGITLISLTITILVLLILVGTMISIFKRQNGVINKSKVAAESSIIAKEKETINIAFDEIKIETYENNYSKEYQNENSGYKIENNNETKEISNYANSLAQILNKQAKTLNDVLIANSGMVKLASLNLEEQQTKKTYKSNGKGILVWDYDNNNKQDYVLDSDWVKVKFENNNYNHLYIVNKWTGKTELNVDNNVGFPLRHPGNYFFIVDAGQNAKWLGIDKYGENIPNGASITYKVSVSNDKNNWENFDSIVDIDKYTRYLKVNISLNASSDGKIPSIDGISVKFKRIENEGKDFGEVIEKTNLTITTLGYTPTDSSKSSVIVQKISLSEPKYPADISNDIKVPINILSSNGNVSNSILVSNDGNSWINISEASSSNKYSYIKIITTINANQNGVVVGIAGYDIKEINQKVVETQKSNQSENNDSKEVTKEENNWITTATEYYYAASEGASTWTDIEVDETKPEGTNITYTYAKSSDGQEWTNFSSNILDNNDSEFIKVKAEFQKKNKDVTENAILNSIQILCKNGNREEKIDSTPVGNSANDIAEEIKNNPDAVKKYYDSKVNYNGEDTWQILYVGNKFSSGKDKVYLISTTARESVTIPADGTVDNTVLKTSPSGANILYWALDANNTASFNHENVKATFHLLNSNNYTSYFNKKYADFAIGAPTEDMLFESANQYYKKSYTYNTNSDYDTYGYFETNRGWTEKNSLPDAPFYCESNYWIASPSSYNNSTSDIGLFRYTDKYINGSSYNKTRGLRPVVCLKDGITLEMQKYGIYKLSTVK